MRIVEDIDRLRKLSDRSVASLARACGSSPPAIGNFLHGKSELGSSKLFQILEELGIPLQKQIRRKLQEKTGFVDPRANDLVKDIVFLFGKLNASNRKIVLASLSKPLARSKDKLVSASLKRVKARMSEL